MKRVSNSPPSPPGKLPLKSPSLLGLRKAWRKNSLCQSVTTIDLLKNIFYRERIFNALNLQKKVSTLENEIGNPCIFPWKAFYFQYFSLIIISNNSNLSYEISNMPFQLIYNKKDLFRFSVQNVLEYRFSLTRTFSYKDRIIDSVLIRENAGQRKPAIWHILYSVFFKFAKFIFKTFFFLQMTYSVISKALKITENKKYDLNQVLFIS